MKKLLIFICLIWSVAEAQIPGYTTVNSRYKWLAGGFEAINIPAGGTPALATGQWVRAGALYVDTTGGNYGVHYYINGVWRRLVDTTMSATTTFEAALNGGSALTTDHTVTASNTDFVWSGFDDYIIDFDSLYFTGAGYINDTVNQKLLTINKTTGSVSLSNWSLTRQTLQQVLTAGATLTGDNTIVNGANTITITNSTLAGDPALFISVNSTAAASNNQMAINAQLLGANANSNQTTQTLYVANTHTGTGSINRGIHLDVNSGSVNNAIYVQSGTVRINAITSASTFDSVVVINDGVLEARLASDIAGSPSLTATYVGYGDGSNVLTGEAAYNYNATTNTLGIDNITTAGAGSTIAINPASGSAVISMKSSAGAFTTTFTYDASRNFISDYRDGEVIRVNGNNIANFTSTGFTVNQGGGTAADFTVRSTSFNPFIFADVSADRFGIGVTTAAQLTHTLTVNGGVRFSTIPTGAGTDSILVSDNGAIEMVAPADLTGLPYWALAGTSAMTTAVTIDQIGENLSFTNGREILFTADVGSALITLNATTQTVITSPAIQFSGFGAGAWTLDASGNGSSVSDIRLKDVQQYYSLPGLHEVLGINPIAYKWKPGGVNETEHTYIGFSAQNIQSALGDDAIGINSKGYLSIQDRAIMAAMVIAIKELNAEIEILKSKIK